MSFLGPGGPRGSAGPSPGGFRTRLREPPLHVMVEQYLAENSNRSYINIEDMIDSLQPLFFRYSRMKRQTFGGMVRRAYHEYCQGKRGPRNETVESTTEDVAECSGEEEEGDSDVEIQQESYLPQQDVTNSRLNSLYAVAPPAPKSASSSSTTGSPGTSGGMISSTNGTRQEHISSTENFMAVPADAFSNATPTKIIGGLTISLMKPKPNEEDWDGNPNNPNFELDNDSDNDLEIIDEVPPTATPSGPTGVVINSASIPIVNTRQIIQSTTAVSKNNNANSCTSDTLNRGQAPAKLPAAPGQRGSVRKSNFDPTVSSELNPKKRIKKDLTGSGNSKLVSDSGLKLSDFAGSEKVVEEICRLLMHLKHPEVYSTLGVTAPRGFLLHGPPGTGKTLLANAIAGELQLPMLKVTGTEFISGISGESESNIRELFNQAIGLAPCIIFIDEIDSITPKRENASKEMERRVVAQLLSCVDDLMNHNKGSQVLLIGATNRIEAIDTALRRAGRFDREICLGIPDEKSRAKILQVICKNLRVAPGFDMYELAKLTPGYVGADLQALVREAAVQAVNKALTGADKTRIASRNTNDESKSNVSLTPTSNVPIQPESKSEIKSVSVTAVTDSSTDKNGINSQSSSSSHDKPENSAKTDDEQKPDTNNCDSSSQQVIDSSQVPDQSELNPEAKDAMEMEVDTVESTPAASSTKTLASENVRLEENNLKPSSIPVLESKTINEPTKNQEQSFLRWIRDTAPLGQDELDQLYIFMDDFEVALKHVQPSSKREGFATVPDTTWDDIGALKNIREELEVSILGPVKHSEAFEMLGLNTPAGVLLCGPPGCGKTLLAKAVANEAGVNFISVKGPELLNMYVGESERAVRQCFLRAKNSAPCVIFFDEIDALCPRRSDGPESGSGSRIVNQLLTEMDGMEGRAGVFIMAATNRPDIIDPAVLRPGRLDKILFVDLPTADDRYEILKAITKDGLKPCVDSDVDLKSIAYSQSCENYSGADLAALVREASIAAFKDLILMQKNACPNKDLKVSARHFDAALLKTKPSVSRKDRDKYAAMKELYSNTSGNH